MMRGLDQLTERKEDEGNGAVFIGRKTQRSLGAVAAVPDISGGRQAYKGAAHEIQLEHENEDELVAVVVKVVHECRNWMDYMMVVNEIENELLEEVEKLEWWFEQDIDDEGEEDEEDGGGDEV
ncbi:hypothetical protein Tco_0349754 [Tanacetum coccineum]